MAGKKHQHHRAPSARPLRVGEEIRHALADIFMRAECHTVSKSGTSITVSEVRVSPDLKNATAYVMPLAGKNQDGVMESLAKAAPELRTMVASRLQLRYAPRISFALDRSFEEAGKIEALLRDPHVARDLSRE